MNFQSEIASAKAIRSWRIFLFFIFALAVLLLYVIEPGFSSFNGRAIGVSALSGVNPSYRVNIYILSLIALFCLSLIICLGRKSSASQSSEREGEWPLAWIILSSAIANFLAHYIAPQADIFFKLGLLGLGLFGVLSLSKQATNDKTQINIVFFTGLVLLLQTITLSFLLFGWSLTKTFWIIFFALFFLYILFINKSIFSVSPVAKALFHLTAISPLLYVFVAEINYFLGLSSPSVAFNVGLFFALAILSTLFFLWRRYDQMPTAYFLGLSLLVTTAAINEYAWSIEYQRYDLFHMGEALIPLQQWFSYSKIPFVDYLPVHGLFDLFPQFLYQLFHRGPELEAYVWGSGYFAGWIMRAIAVGVLFTLLSRMMNPVVAFFLLWLLPTFPLLDPYYTPLLIPAIHLLTHPKSTDDRLWWCVHWALTGVIFLWRIDFGIVVAASNIGIGFCLAWHYSSSKYFFRVLVGLLPISLFLLLLWISLAGWDSFLSSLDVIRSFIVYQSQITSYPVFYKELDSRVLLQYVVLPGLTVIMLAWSVGGLLSRGVLNKNLSLQLVIVFLGAVTLIISVRSLQRHSLYEGAFSNYLYVLFALLFVIRFWPFQRVSSLVVFLPFFIMSAELFMPKGKVSIFKNHSVLKLNQQTPIGVSPRALPVWSQSGPRLVDEAGHYKDFLSFMGKNLKPEQTFFDFSNAPLLYTLADVELPVYVFETVYQTSDIIQSNILKSLAGLYDEGRLPYVIFRQNNLWDKLDGVDHALRSFKLAEFIYQNYQPCIRLSGLDIWVAKIPDSINSCKDYALFYKKNYASGVFRGELLSPTYLEQFIDYRHLPNLWANYDNGPETINEEIELSAVPTGEVGWVLGAAEPLSCSGQPCYLDIVVKSTKQQSISLSFDGSAQAGFEALPGKNRYRLRLSILWRWHQGAPEGSLVLAAGSPFEVERAVLRIIGQDQALPGANRRFSHSNGFPEPDQIN